MNNKKPWEQNQYKRFEDNWNKKWSKKFPNKSKLKNKIIELNYNNFYDVNNAFGKLDKALQICDFLKKLSYAKPPQDTEKIIITILVSCAEAIYKINKPEEDINENLIKGFFKPVQSKLKGKIKGHTETKMPYNKTFDSTEVIYLIRNDYIHNGNFTGKVFRLNSSEKKSYNHGLFYYYEKENKNKLIQVFSSINLSYLEFINIFLESFILNIEKYCTKHKK